MPFAWAERNWDQVGPIRRGAGGKPWRRRTEATLVFDTVTAIFLSSPTMRRYPHRGFSRARRQIRLTVSSGREGRPGPRCRSEEHTSELQSLKHLVCRLLL